MKKDIFDDLAEIKHMKKDIFDRLLEISNRNDYIEETMRLADDPVLFIEKHGKLIHPMHGVVPSKLYLHQEELLHSYHENRFNIVHSARQTGLTQTTSMYAFHHAFFGNDKTVAIISNKLQDATDILNRIRILYEHLPESYKNDNWLTVNNKHEISFVNGSTILAKPASVDALRGYTTSLVIMDNFAYLTNRLQEEIYQSVMPTIYPNGKMIITSTAAALNTPFKQIWDGAVNGNNKFVAHNIKWNVIPGRDDKFKEEMISQIGEQRWKVEFECPTTIKENHNGKSSECKFKET